MCLTCVRTQLETTKRNACGERGAVDVDIAVARQEARAAQQKLARMQAKLREIGAEAQACEDEMEDLRRRRREAQAMEATLE